MESKIRKVFIAEDNPMYRFCLEARLGARFPVVKSFITGSEMLKALSEMPDVVVLDHYFMDSLSGLEVLPQIKRFNPNIQVIILSGQAKVTVAVESLKLGAFDYVEKGDGEFERLDEVLDRLWFESQKVTEAEKTPFGKRLFFPKASA